MTNKMRKFLQDFAAGAGVVLFLSGILWALATGHIVMTAILSAIFVGLAMGWAVSVDV